MKICLKIKFGLFNDYFNKVIFVNSKIEKMSKISIKSTLHKRITTFVDWIKPASGNREHIKNVANGVRERIKNKAASKDYDFVITSTLNGGSFATKSGLRRHMRGEAVVEGLDVDLVFVLQDNKKDYELISLLDSFEQITQDCYPTSSIKPTKSSIKLTFSDNLYFDIVPMIEGKKEGTQLLIRSTGEEIHTSVQDQVEFIRKRIRESNEKAGRVKFNECLRLMKWWRDFKAVDSYYLGDKKAPPSFLINLLAAKAFDELSVQKTYGETLAQWFSYLAHVVKHRDPILFKDYNTPKQDAEALWSVVDPVNKDNNVVVAWTNLEIDELAEWLATSRDDLNRALRHDSDGNDHKAIDSMVRIFGNAFKNHCY